MLAILLLLIISAILLAFSSSIKLNLYQAVLLLASMGLIFFATHPLAHYLIARLYGVGVAYFYLAPSDFRKLPHAGTIGKMIPTIGTKLDQESFHAQKPGNRGIILGSGAIVSSIVMALPLLFALTFNYSLLSLLLGCLLLGGNVASELAFSTKVGDLYKMKREFLSQ